MKIRIGTRKSRLALVQTDLVRQKIKEAFPEAEIEIVEMSTKGDELLDWSLTSFGGKGVFTKELEEALLREEIDLAVHSAKDMPMEFPEGLGIGAVLSRADVRDVLVTTSGTRAADLAPGSVVGTSSLRRELQIKEINPLVKIRLLRGNVQTRLRKLKEGQYDAILLAAAGLERLGITEEDGICLEYLEPDTFLPAAGQGILAVQGRKDVSWRWIRDVDVPQSRYAALAERQFIRTTEGDCTSPCAAHAQVNGNELKLTGLYCDENMQNYSVDTVLTEASRAQQAGEALAEKMIKRMR